MSSTLHLLGDDIYRMPIEQHAVFADAHTRIAAVNADISSLMTSKYTYITAQSLCNHAYMSLYALHPLVQYRYRQAYDRDWAKYKVVTNKHGKVCMWCTKPLGIRCAICPMCKRSKYCTAVCLVLHQDIHHDYCHQ